MLREYDEACLAACRNFYSDGGFRDAYEPLIDRQLYIEKLKGTWTWDSTGIAVGPEAQKLYRLESAEGKENRRFEAIVKL